MVRISCAVSWLIALPLVVVVETSAHAVETSSPKSTNSGATSRPVADNEEAPMRAAQRVYLDPTTGRLTDHPPPGVPALELSARELQMLDTSDAGLVQIPLQGGGHGVYLQGRFRHLGVAIIGPDGKLRVQEVTGEELNPQPAPDRAAPTEDERDDASENQ